MPLAQALVYYVVFKLILKVQIPNYVAYIVSGVLFWTFFANTLSFGMEGLVGNRALLTKIPIPLQVFALVETLSNLITLILAVPVLVLVLTISSIAISWASLFFVYYIVIIALIAYGLANALSVLLVVFADLKYIFSLLIQLWMYATPIFYDVKMIPTEWKWAVSLNPIGSIFVGMHAALLDSAVPSSRDILIPMMWAVASLLFGYTVLALGRKKGIVELL